MRGIFVQHPIPYFILSLARGVRVRALSAQDGRGDTMANATNLDRPHLAPSKSGSDASRSSQQIERRPKWPVRLFLVTAILTASAMIAMLFSPLYPSPDIGTALAFAVAFGFLVLFLTALKAVDARGISRAR